MFKVFNGNNALATKYVHCNIFGLRFRVAYHKRGMKRRYGTYVTGRGRVFNLGRHYLSYIKV